MREDKELPQNSETLVWSLHFTIYILRNQPNTSKVSLTSVIIRVTETHNVLSHLQLEEGMCTM